MFGQAHNTSGMVVATDTAGFLAMCRDAERHDSNRQVETENLSYEIDPKGIHVLVFKMMHNSSEWRTNWLVKLKDTMEPQMLWLDVSFGCFEGAARLKTAEGFFRASPADTTPG